MSPPCPPSNVFSSRAPFAVEVLCSKVAKSIEGWSQEAKDVSTLEMETLLVLHGLSEQWVESASRVKNDSGTMNEEIAQTFPQIPVADPNTFKEL